MAIIANIKTVISNGPTALTQRNANMGNLSPVSGAYIMDYAGLCNLILNKLAEARTLTQALVTTTDAADPSLATLNTILADLV